MPRTLIPALITAALLAHSAVTSGAAHAATNIALAPLDALGGKSSRQARKTQAQVAKALSSVPGVTFVAPRRVRSILKKNPTLRTCEGDAACLAQLGQKAGASHVVYGEIGGLGKVAIVYLTLVDVSRARAIRSTTIEIGGKDGAAKARAAAFRLLTPKRYVGRLAVTVDADGASVYIDGKRVARSPAAPLNLSVGTHALRVTHPEFRDYVRFIDIEFDNQTDIAVDLQKFDVVSSDISRDPETGQPLGNVVYRGVEPTPWYRKWYTIAGVGGALLIGSAIVVGVIANGIDNDREEVVRDPRP